SPFALRAAADRSPNPPLRHTPCSAAARRAGSDATGRGPTSSGEEVEALATSDFNELRVSSTWHQHGVDDVNHAIRLIDVRNGDPGDAALGVDDRNTAAAVPD